MRRLLTATLALGLLGAFVTPVSATPEEDLEKFRSYFHKRFPNTPKDDFINGVYSIDAASREQWEEIEEFPTQRRRPPPTIQLLSQTSS